MQRNSRVTGMKLAQETLRINKSRESGTQVERHQKEERNQFQAIPERGLSDFRSMIKKHVFILLKQTKE